MEAIKLCRLDTPIIFIEARINLSRFSSLHAGRFSRSGWLWPVDAKGEPLKATSYMAVGFYVAKYVNKKSDMDLAAKGLGAKEWNNSLKTKLSLLPKKLFRIRMSRNFGMKMLTMTNLSTECLIQLTKLGYDATPFNQIL